MEIRRTLASHSPLRRNPQRMLRRMLDTLPADCADDPDAPVARLEERLADLLGKPRALFFPSGTMAQQVALRIHAERTGRRAFAAHPMNHLDLWEQHGYSVIHGLRFQSAGDPHSLLTLEDLDDVKEPVAALLIELPQREIGGVLPTWDDLTAQVGWARARGAAAHLDGARLWESQPFYDRPHAEIAALFDTVYVSLYKGLEGVRGAVLAGTEDVIDEASVWRHRLGGAIPDAWPLALAALVGLDEVLPKMSAFRDHAVALAAAITEGGVATVLPNPPQTSMFHVVLPVGSKVATQASEQLAAEQGVQLFRRAGSDLLPDRSRIELSVTENAMAFAPEEVAELLADVVARARRLAAD
jgi:threonine aldolase